MDLIMAIWLVLASPAPDYLCVSLTKGIVSDCVVVYPYGRPLKPALQQGVLKL